MKRQKQLLLLTTVCGLALQTAAAQAQYAYEVGIKPLAAPGTPSTTQGSLSTVDGATVNRETFCLNQQYNIPEGVEVGSYFATWGVYGRKYFPQDVPVERMSEVYIAFAAICGDNTGAYSQGAGAKRECGNPHNGESAPYYIPGIKSLQDDKVTFVDDSWAWYDNKMNANLTGLPDSMIGTMLDWKRRNPNLKIVVSVGGWSYSRPFYDVLADNERRNTLVQSIVDTLSQPGFDMIDGIDIDYEFPGGGGLDTDKGNPAIDGANYLLFAKELRAALTDLGDSKDRYYKLTAAMGVGEDKLANWAQSSTVSELLDQLDRLGLMTYDFEGAWSGYAGFNSALDEPGDTKQVQSIKGALKTLQSLHGVRNDQLNKIAIGYPAYTRSTMIKPGITDPSSIPLSDGKGGGKYGTVEGGILSYFDLVERVIGPDGQGLNGWKIYSYPEFGATMAYHPDTGEVHSFMSPDDVRAVAEFVKETGLRGMFSWQIDDDNGELHQAVLDGLGLQSGSVTPGKPAAYAPDCQEIKSSVSDLVIKPGMTFSADGKVYQATAWASNCPGAGAAWEQAQWSELGNITDFQAFGVSYGKTEDVVVEPSQGTTTPVMPTTPNNADTTTTPKDTEEPMSEPSATDGSQTTANTPSDTGQNTTSSNMASDASGSTWSGSTVYNTGDVVVHNGSTWTAGWWTQGEEPGTTGEWGVWKKLAGNAPAAPAATTPTTQSTTPTAEPTQSNSGSTPTAVSGSTWDSSAVYNNGDVVTHNGADWAAQWWTQGEEPGTTGEWGVWRKK